MFPSYRNQICIANQLTGFYMMGTLAIKRLNIASVITKDQNVEKPVKIITRKPV